MTGSVSQNCVCTNKPPGLLTQQLLEDPEAPEEQLVILAVQVNEANLSNAKGMALAPAMRDVNMRAAIVACVICMKLGLRKVSGLSTLDTNLRTKRRELFRTGDDPHGHGSQRGYIYYCVCGQARPS